MGYGWADAPSAPAPSITIDVSIRPANHRFMEILLSAFCQSLLPHSYHRMPPLNRGHPWADLRPARLGEQLDRATHPSAPGSLVTAKDVNDSVATALGARFERDDAANGHAKLEYWGD